MYQHAFILEETATCVYTRPKKTCPKRHFIVSSMGVSGAIYFRKGE